MHNDGCIPRHEHPKQEIAEYLEISALLQCRELRLSLLQCRNRRFGILPKCKKIFISNYRPGTGALRINSAQLLTLQGIRPRQSQMCQRPSPAIPHEPAVIKNLLELSRRSRTIAHRQIGLTSYVWRIETRSIRGKWNHRQLQRLRRQ